MDARDVGDICYKWDGTTYHTAYETISMRLIFALSQV